MLIACSSITFPFLFEDHQLDVSINSNGDNGGATEKETPQKREQIKVEHLSIGGEYSVLLTEAGHAHLFDITTGELGQRLTSDKIVSVGAGQEHVLLLNTKGQVLSYGTGSRGQLGHGCLESIKDGEAKLVEALDGLQMRSIAAGGWHSLALSNQGDVYVWGWNESGQLGLAKAKVQIQAVPIVLDVSEDDSFQVVSAGSRHSMAISENGILFGWGWNKYGQLGLDAKVVESVDQPQVIPVDERVSS